MENEKTRIRIGKKIIRYYSKNGATLKDIDREIFEWLAKIFEGEEIGDYNGKEKENLTIYDLTISNGITEVKIEKI